MVASPVENHSIVILKLEHKVILIFIELSKVVHNVIIKLKEKVSTLDSDL